MLDFDKNALIQRLRSAMHDADVSSASLADAADVSPAAVAQWLKNGKISLEKLVVVAERLGTSLDWLLVGKEPHENSTISHPEFVTLFHRLPPFQQDAVVNLLRSMKSLPKKVQPLDEPNYLSTNSDESMPSNSKDSPQHTG